jgi:hypothetical protein
MLAIDSSDEKHVETRYFEMQKHHQIAIRKPPSVFRIVESNTHHHDSHKPRLSANLVDSS